MNDVLQVHGTAPSFFRFFIQTSGTLGAQGGQQQAFSGYGPYWTAAGSSAYASFGTNGTMTGVASGTAESVVQTSSNGTPIVSHSTGGGWHGDLFFGFVDVPYVGQSDIPFFVGFGGSASFGTAGSFSASPGESGAAFFDYANTGYLAGIDAFDANGNSVIQQAHVTFASGTQYFLGTPTLTTTPEPETLPLVATGLVAVLPLRRRRANCPQRGHTGADTGRGSRSYTAAMRER